MEFKKTHPAFLVWKSLDSLKNLYAFLISLGIVNLLKSNNVIFIIKMLLLGIIGIILLLLAYSIISWLNYKYCITEHTIIVRKGILLKKEIVLPFEKVHTVELVQSWYNRMLGASSLRLETPAKDKEADIMLLLEYKKAVELKWFFEKETRGSDAADTENRLNYKASILSLIITAVFSNAMFAVIGFAFWAYDNLEKFVPDSLEKYFLNNFNGFVEKTSFIELISDILLLLAVAILISVIISVFITLVRFWGFTVNRDKDKLHITYGLFSRRTVVIPVKRIQSITIKQSPLKQLTGFYDVRAESVGLGDEKKETSLILMAVRSRELSKELHKILPEFCFEYNLVGIKPGVFRNIMFICLFWPAAAVVVAGLIWVYLWWLAIALVYFAWLGFSIYKNEGICFSKDFLILKTRRFGIKTVIVPKRNIQSLEVSQAIWQKRKGICKYSVTVISESLKKEYSVRYMDKALESGLNEWYFKF